MPMPSDKLQGHHTGGSFELSPLISEIVRWNDADIIERNHRYNKLEVSIRVLLISQQLELLGFAKFNRRNGFGGHQNNCIGAVVDLRLRPANHFQSSVLQMRSWSISILIEYE